MILLNYTYDNTCNYTRGTARSTRLYVHLSRTDTGKNRFGRLYGPVPYVVLRVKVADGDFPVTVVCNKVAGIHITSDVTNVCILSYEDWLDVRP